MKNSDGSVTTKVTGKVAQTPKGSGTGQVKPVQARSSVAGPRVVRTPGRGPVARTQSGRK